MQKANELMFFRSDGHFFWQSTVVEKKILQENIGKSDASELFTAFYVFRAKLFNVPVFKEYNRARQ